MKLTYYCIKCDISYELFPSTANICCCGHLLLERTMYQVVKDMQAREDSN